MFTNAWYMPDLRLDAGAGVAQWRAKHSWALLWGRLHPGMERRDREKQDRFRNQCHEENKPRGCDGKWWEAGGSETREGRTELMVDGGKQTKHVQRRSTFRQNLLQRLFHKDSGR